MSGPLLGRAAVALATAASVVAASVDASAQAFAPSSPPVVAGPPSDASSSTPAPALATVHLEADEPVELQTKVNDKWTTVCSSPCDKPFPVDGAYRINGSGVRASKAFRLTPGQTRLEIETGSSTGHALSVVVTVVGVVGFVPGLAVTAAVAGGLFIGLIIICPLVDAFSTKTTYGQCLGDIATDIGKGYLQPWVWIPAAAGGVLVTGGVIGLATSHPTRVNPVASPAPGAAAQLRTSPSRAPDWQVPIGGTTQFPALANTPVIPLVRLAF